jgi:hypothetical protein
MGQDHAHGRNGIAGGESASGYALLPAAGHNAAGRAAQWQDLHEHAPRKERPDSEADFDLVEASFAETFPRASDPTSFLRLASIPFAGRAADGRVLRLLRVEHEEVTDVAAVAPALGGGPVRYDPLPAALVATRRRLRFVYLDEGEVVSLSLEEARALTALDPAER